MAGNSFGKAFVLTTFGESHGEAIGGIIDGCPSGLELDHDYIQLQMDRRRPGQSNITTQRSEADQVQFLSGIFEGKTTGAPIGFLIQNKDAKSKDYDHLKEVYRPSHADYTYASKYGHRDHRGGGRSSARETACRVVAGAIAQLYLKQKGIDIHAYVDQIGEVKLTNTAIDYKLVFENKVRCPNQKRAEEMIALIESIKKEGDTIGGRISCHIHNVPVGLGEPVFDKLHADLGKAMLSINAVKGFEIGSGFEAVNMKGSEHNDVFHKEEGKIKTKTNHSGGIQGGISNGENIEFKVAFKPVATLMQTQQSVDSDGNEAELKGKGRHDPCVVPRAVPIVSAMAALVIMDHYLRHKIYQD